MAGAGGLAERPERAQQKRVCTSSIGSIAAKIRRSLGYEGGNSFLRVVGLAGDDDRIFFGVELIGQSRLERLAQHPADGAEGVRRAGGEFLGEGGGFAVHLMVRR